MKRVIPVVMAILALSTGAQAKNQVYGVEGRSIESDGYKLFASDKIVGTVYKTDTDNASGAGYCTTADENTSTSLGDINTIRSDNRLSIADTAKISYSAVCITYNAVVDRLKTADDIRRLWLLFGDSATDEYVVEALKKKGSDEKLNEEVYLMIELKRLAIVSKYIEYFTKNNDWKLTDYTFLSQAFKARKGKILSPAYVQFIQALLTGDTEKAFHVVASIDIENLGGRLGAPNTSDRMQTK